MYSELGDLKEAGFPHSEICGSAPICRLPAAYRRLSRPSSPVIAKASTTCTYSLDPITLLPLERGAPDQSRPEHHAAIGNSRACASPIKSLRSRTRCNTSPSVPATRARHHNAPFCENNYLLSQIVKDQPIKHFIMKKKHS